MATARHWNLSISASFSVPCDLLYSRISIPTGEICPVLALGRVVAVVGRPHTHPSRRRRRYARRGHLTAHAGGQRGGVARTSKDCQLQRDVGDVGFLATPTGAARVCGE